MRFSWTGLILAPLLAPTLLSIAMVSLQDGDKLFEFAFLMIPGCIISYCATMFLLLPSLYLFSQWRPLTGLTVCLLGAVLGALVFVPLTWMAWKGSGIDSGPPSESFLTFFVRWSADPLTAIFPLAGLMTSALYWRLAKRRDEPSHG